MQIQVSGHQIEVTPALREYALNKIERIARHFERVIDLRIVLSMDKLKFKAEATLTCSQKTIHAIADAPDMYAAIDILSDKLDRQVRKHKEKITDHHRADAQKQRASV